MLRRRLRKRDQRTISLGYAIVKAQAKIIENQDRTIEAQERQIKAQDEMLACLHEVFELETGKPGPGSPEHRQRLKRLYAEAAGELG